jgi:hypothetical protein
MDVKFPDEDALKITLLLGRAARFRRFALDNFHIYSNTVTSDIQDSCTSLLSDKARETVMVSLQFRRKVWPYIFPELWVVSLAASEKILTALALCSIDSPRYFPSHQVHS